ncbi:MAG: flippase-like domain-containing protein [Proteobacteria bacterium]|nr:flippase-like domain-containing protein [Pseudomonadota bacterium]
MRILKILYLLLGLVLLGMVLAEVDIAEVASQIKNIGFGILVLLALYLVAFIVDTIAWQMALVKVPLNARWTYRAWKLRMISEVFNTVIPAAGLGGEPLKIELLKKQYDIGYREAAASIILAKTFNLCALVVFLIIGFVFMSQSAALDAAFGFVAGIGLLVFSTMIILFFAVQRWRIISLTGTWLSGFHFARRLGSVLHHINDMEERLIDFYTNHGGRFAGALLLSFINWCLGVAEIYYTMIFLGHQMTLTDAWIIEAAVQLVRNGIFFIPGSIGTQEAVFFLVYSSMTGSPSLGVAVAVVRRFREILWLLGGLLLGVFLPHKSMFAKKPSESVNITDSPRER